MHPIQHDRVGEHEDCFEDVEVRLVGVAEIPSVTGPARSVSICCGLHFARPPLEVLHNSVYAAHRDECRTDIHGPDYFAQIHSEELCVLDSPMPDDKDGHVSRECARLQDQCSLD